MGQLSQEWGLGSDPSASSCLHPSSLAPSTHGPTHPRHPFILFCLPPYQLRSANLTFVLLGLVVGTWKPAHLHALAFPHLCQCKCALQHICSDIAPAHVICISPLSTLVCTLCDLNVTKSILPCQKLCMNQLCAQSRTKWTSGMI